MAQGSLRIECFIEESYIPVSNVTISVRPSNSSSDVQDKVLYTNSIGSTVNLNLDAPEIEYSKTPSENMPYSIYDIKVEKEGFKTIIIWGCQVFPNVLAVQRVNMIEASNTKNSISKSQDIIIVGDVENINIKPHMLFGNYEPKIPEAMNKPLIPPLVGVVNKGVSVPEYIIVNSGQPSNLSAPNYKISYKQYIKNVAASSIYPTWSDSTIRANIYVIISFTLNRIYTHWYRGRLENFDITNSTAYDLPFSYGRNIYSNIDNIVDEIFTTFIKDKNRKQALLALSCDGDKIKCNNWLDKWESKRLGDSGKTPIEILRNFYGDDIELVLSKEVEGVEIEFKGSDLVFNSESDDVKIMQEYLNEIAKVYKTIITYTPAGIYGYLTQQAVLEFQKIFGLKQTGNIDYATWYKIIEVYNSIKDLNSSNS